MLLGFSRPRGGLGHGPGPVRTASASRLPTVVFAVTATLSMLGLGFAIRHIPLGTAYAIWVGIGAALTVGWAMATGVEAFSIIKVVLIAGIVACAAGLKSLPAGTPETSAAPDKP